MSAGEQYSKAVGKMTITRGPYHEFEGMAGYIETEAELEIKDLERFTNLWYSYYRLSDTKKLYAYGLAKGLGDCK
jgi:hypothetical protein